MLFRVALCDDSKASKDYLSLGITNAFKRKGHLATVTCFSSASAVIKTPDFASRFNLFFLDIDMPVINGIQLAKRIRAEASGTGEIVFISNREEKVFEALKTQPLRFIRKRFFYDEIDETIDAFLCKQIEQKGDFLSFKTQDGMWEIRCQSIQYIESHDKAQRIVTTQGEHFVPSTQKALHQKLDSQSFVKVHRSYIVNFQHVQLIGHDFVLLDQNDKIPISRRKRDEIKEAFQRWLM